MYSVFGNLPAKTIGKTSRRKSSPIILASPECLPGIAPAAEVKLLPPCQTGVRLVKFSGARDA
jgi:hypothetical protein